WHGQGDTTLTYSQNWPAEVQQWVDLWGVSNPTNEMIRPDGAQDTWNRDSYSDASGTVVVETNSGPSSVPHDLTGRGLFGDVVRFFGLDRPADPGAGGSGAGGAAAGGAGGSAANVGGGGSGPVVVPAGGVPAAGGT